MRGVITLIHKHGMLTKTLWLVADDPEGSWWCGCRQGIVDAPWHNKGTFPTDGSGWLWSCAKCSRGFMFAKGAMIRGTLEQLARRRTPRVQKSITQTGQRMETVLLANPEDWLNVVRPLAASISGGDRFVFFYGHVFPAKHGPIKFDGLFRSHDLPELPHLSDSLIEQTLANPAYWRVT
jgi:hypothetical protein